MNQPSHEPPAVGSLYDPDAIDGLPDIFYVFDRLGRMLQWNHRLELVTGFSGHDIARMGAADFIHPDDAALVRAKIAEAFVAGAASAAVRLRDRSGRVTPYLLTGYRNDRNGDPVIVGMGIDMTEERARQARLEQLVDERTAELRAVNKELERRARHDPLTGLPNRDRLFGLIDGALASARAGGGAFVVLFVDLDDFKAVNDRFGHRAGDDILRAFALRLLRCVRAQDTVGRVAGDEFLVLLGAPVTVADATSVQDRIEALAAEPLRYGGGTVRLGASVGMARSEGEHADAAEVVHQADLRMYDAKRRR